jgi:hypothetical protein
MRQFGNVYGAVHGTIHAPFSLNTIYNLGPRSGATFKCAARFPFHKTPSSVPSQEPRAKKISGELRQIFETIQSGCIVAAKQRFARRHHFCFARWARGFGGSRLQTGNGGGGYHV